MKIFFNNFGKKYLSVILSVVITCAIVALGAYASTTVGNNVSIGGTLDVTGAVQATSTLMVTGATTLYSTLNVTGLSTFSTATSTSATSSAYMFVGVPFSNDANMNFAGGDLFVTDALNVGGVTYFDGAVQATSSLLVTGATSLYSTLNVTGLSIFAGGIDTAGATTDITLKNDETITNATNGNIAFSGTAMSMATTTATTTPGIWVAAPGGNTTSTVAVGHGGDTYGNLAGCIELWREGSPYKIYINTTGDGLVVAAGRCKE